MRKPPPLPGSPQKLREVFEEKIVEINPAPKSKARSERINGRFFAFIMVTVCGKRRIRKRKARLAIEKSMRKEVAFPQSGGENSGAMLKRGSDKIRANEQNRVIESMF